MEIKGYLSTKPFEEMTDEEKHTESKKLDRLIWFANMRAKNDSMSFGFEKEIGD